MREPPAPPLLLDPKAFGAAPGSTVELIQTHIGYVYLVEAFAFKLKKPVRFDFLDFSTLEQRRWACDREVTLNRRLCPDLYLGLFPVVQAPDGSRRVAEVGDTCEVVDWCVKMKRMPLERLFDRLLKDDHVSLTDVEAIANVLAPFYKAQRGTLPTGGLGDLEAVAFNIDENLREGRGLKEELLPVAQLNLIEARARHFLKRHGEEIRSRARDGFIVDGHGDLRAENICLPENQTPLLFDCIEFNDRFRIADSAQDIAFLAMELEARGRADLADHFVNCYRTRCDSGLSDRLLNFYLGYRAFIKGKVDAWIAGDGGIPEDQRREAAVKARNYFDLSLNYALRGNAILLVFCGVSGSGKSTLARVVAERLRGAHLSTDMLRDELISKGVPTEQRYSLENSTRVYAEMLRRAETALTDGKIVLLDGTFSAKISREKALELARKMHIPAIAVWAECSPEAAASHIEERTRSGEMHGSEATESISLAQRQRFEGPSLDEDFAALVRVNTETNREAAQARAWDGVVRAIHAALDEMSEN